MKVLVTALSVASMALIVAVAVYAQPRAEEKPKFHIEIQAAAEGGSKFSVTNLSGRTVTACVLEFSSSSESKPQSRIVWDAPLQGERPLEQGASISENLGHVVGGPLPDRVEVVAGIWADGETFGVSDWVNVILANRADRASKYEQAASLLRRGLDQNWTREQYLEAIRAMPNVGPIYGIRSTLEANQELNNKPALLQRVIHTLLESLNQKSELLRQAKSPANLSPIP